MPPDEQLDAAARCGLEALLFLADEPLPVDACAEVLQATPAAVEATLHELAATYRDEGRGIEIRAAAGGWRMYTAEAAKPYVERWALAGRTGRLTQAALETLAVIAYKQPIGRQQIGDIRGVNADGAVRSLVARGLVEEVGRDQGPGQAALFGTTPLFLERLGLDALEELPPLTDYLPEAPAPDEPEPDGFAEVRRRLAAGGDLPSERLARAGGDGGTESGDVDEDDDEVGLLPPPSAPIGGDDDEQMDELTDRLEHAARNAVDRLRAAVRAGESSEPDPDAEAQARDESTPGDQAPPPDAPARPDDAERDDG